MSIHRAINPDYRKIDLLQRSLLIAGSGLIALFKPSRGDMVATFGETTADCTLNKMKNKMLNDPEGLLILKERPIINTKTISLDYLSKLPDNTFGKHYYKLLERDMITPDSRNPVNFIEDEEMAYVMKRYREIHDFTHCLLGMRTNLVGEVTVKWFEAIQYDLPMCWLGGMFGSLRLRPKDSKTYLNYYLPWVIDNAINCKPLITVYFEKYFEVPMDELRQQLNLIPPPVITKN
jgi:ubiquinone biosynthesis protein COQ4